VSNTEKTYSRVTEAEKMIQGLCKKQPEVLWCVRPEIVAVYGIENKDRPEKNKILAKIRTVKGSGKAILQDNNIPIRYIIELYWSDWNEWKETKKQWILLRELLHIHHDIGKTIKHDCEDWRIIIDKVGVCGYDSETLPDLINGEVKFNLDLRPSIEDSEDNETDDVDEKL
jgi:predicted metallopeptidase